MARKQTVYVVCLYKIMIPMSMDTWSQAVSLELHVLVHVEIIMNTGVITTRSVCQR